MDNHILNGDIYTREDYQELEEEMEILEEYRKEMKEIVEFESDIEDIFDVKKVI